VLITDRGRLVAPLPLSSRPFKSRKAHRRKMPTLRPFLPEPLAGLPRSGLRHASAKPPIRTDLPRRSRPRNPVPSRWLERLDLEPALGASRPHGVRPFGHGGGRRFRRARHRGAGCGSGGCNVSLHAPRRFRRGNVQARRGLAGHPSCGAATGRAGKREGRRVPRVLAGISHGSPLEVSTPMWRFEFEEW